MNLPMLVAPLFVLWLLAMLYVGPSYFRRLSLLIARLESHHQPEFERLGRPSLGVMTTTMGSAIAIVRFVLRKDYLQLSDDELAKVGDATRVRLLFSLTGMLFPFLIFPFMASRP